MQLIFYTLLNFTKVDILSFFYYIFFDKSRHLIDTYNQSLYDSSRPNDQISGYEYNVLNVLLFDTYGLASLKSNLKLWKPNTVTDEQIDTFLAKYEELLEND